VTAKQEDGHEVRTSRSSCCSVFDEGVYRHVNDEPARNTD